MKKHFFSLRERGLFLLLLGLFLSFSSYAQDITVKGVVKDSKFGDPIIGASVLVKGTTNGTISDMDGNFTLAAPKDGTLTISYIGYKSQEIPVNGQQNLNIILDEDVEALDEVVVVGYATGSKRTISGAVERIKKEDMNQGVVNTPLESLKGKVAGVVISKTGGDPASKPSIRVRGTTSLSGGNDPLVIIDGVFGDLSMLDAIAPADIETFTILKDASETAQYGSRGAAGVIVVTTVKGKNGMKTLSYNGNFGISNVYKNLKMLSADEFRSTAKALGMTPLDMGGNTNFFDEIEQLGYTQNHNISFGAGNDDSNYRASVGVIDQQGIIKNSGMKNYTAKLDASQNMFNNKLKIEFGMFGSLKQVDYTNDYEKTFYSAATYNPTFPTHKNEDGKWDEDPYANEIQNPLGRLEIQDREKNAYVNVHGKLTWTILDGLKLSAFGSYTYNVKENMKYIPKDLKAITQTSDAHGYRADNKQNILMGNIQLSYNKDLNEKHHIDALALVEGQKYHYTGFSAGARGFETDYFGYNNLKAGGTVKYGDVTSFQNENRLASFMGRFNYMYDNRFIATVNLRADGSSKLGMNNKWGFFPSASAAWVLNEEAFLKDVDWLSQLKLRAGYGLTGNQDAIEAYNSLALMSPNGVTSVNGNSTATYGFTRNSNPDLRWEETTTWNAGFDFGFLDNRITSSLDYYYRETKDLINVIDVPAGTNFKNRIVSNIGSLRNQGVEFSINAKAISTPDWKWDLGFNVAWNNNEITKLTAQDDASSIVLTGTVEGGTGTMIQAQGVNHPANSFYVYEQVYDQQGNPIEGLYVDRNGDGVINDEDRYFCHKPAADVTMGFTSKLVWKAWDFSFSLRSNLGNYVYNNVASSNAALSEGSINNKGYLSNRPLSAFDTNFQNMNVLSDYYVQNASFLRCDNITLGYSFNKLFGVLGGRIYGTVQNPFVITKYKGLDPEVANAADKTFGIDKNVYPRPLVGILGVSLNF